MMPKVLRQYNLRVETVWRNASCVSWADVQSARVQPGVCLVNVVPTNLLGSGFRITLHNSPRNNMFLCSLVCGPIALEMVNSDSVF